MSICYTIVVFLHLIYTTQTAGTYNFTSDYTHPFPLTNTLKPINLMIKSDSEQIWSIFSDNSITKYNNDLTEPTAIETFSNISISSLSFYFTTGVVWNSSYYSGSDLINSQQNISARVAIVIDSTKKTISVCNSQNLTILVIYNFNNQIVCTRAIPINFTPSGLIYLQIIITNSSVLTLFKGVTSEIVNLGVPITAGLIVKQTWLSSNLNNVLHFQNFVFAGLNNGSMFQIEANITITYDAVSNSFTFAHSKKITKLYDHNQAVTDIFLLYNLIISQDSSSIIPYEFIQLKKGKVTAAFSGKVLKQVVIIKNVPYLVYSDRYIEVIIKNKADIHDVVTLSVICDTPNPCNYFSINGSSINFAYRKSKTSLYKLSLCNGPGLQFNNSCSPYSCSVSNCADCSLSPILCSICSTSYQRSNDFLNCSLASCTITNCNLCQNNTCQVCIQNYDLTNNTCQPHCNISNCLSCTVPNTCSQCQSNYTINSTFCSFINITIITPFITPVVTDEIAYLISCGFISDPTRKDKCLTFLNNDVSKYSMVTNQVIMSTPVISQTLGWLSPLLTFNNDYWYYIYHNRTYQNLLLTNIFFQIISKINNQRMVPFFINETNAVEEGFVTQLHDYFTENMTNYSNYRVLLLNSQSTQFMINIHAMILWNYSFAIAILLIFKFVFEVLKSLRRKENQLNKTLRNFGYTRNSNIYFKISKFFLQNSTFSFLIVSLIESNCIFICFYAGLQLKIPFQFQFADKLNIAVCLIFLFLCLVFSLVFYKLLWAFKVKFTRNLIDDKKIQYSSYCQTSTVIFIKSVLYGLVQSIFITQYQIVIGSLISLKICLLVISIKSYNVYKYGPIATIKVLYNFFGLLYDCFLLLTYIITSQEGNSTSIFIQNWFLCQSVLLGGIIISVILLILLISFYAVYNICKRDRKLEKNIQEEMMETPKIVIIGAGNKNRISDQSLMSSMEPKYIKFKQIICPKFHNIFSIQEVQTGKIERGSQSSSQSPFERPSIHSEFQPQLIFDRMIMQKMMNKKQKQLQKKKCPSVMRTRDTVNSVGSQLQVTKRKTLVNIERWNMKVKQNYYE